MITGIATGPKRGAKRPNGGRVWDHGREIFENVCIKSFFPFTLNAIIRVGYVAAYRPINSLLPPPPSFFNSPINGGWRAWVLVALIAVPVERQWCSQDLSTWGQSDRAWGGCVCVGGGGGGGIPHPMVGRFFNYVYPNCLFLHIKRLII